MPVDPELTARYRAAFATAEIIRNCRGPATRRMIAAHRAAWRKLRDMQRDSNPDTARLAANLATVTHIANAD